jgi:CHAD domain-containing protein
MALDIERIQKSIRKLRKQLKHEQKRPTPEEVHSLRTHTRRIEAALKAMSMRTFSDEKRLVRQLKHLRHRAGGVRDLDVFIGFVTVASIKPEQDCVVQFLEYLGEARLGTSDRLHRWVQKNNRGVRRRLKDIATRLETFATADVGTEMQLATEGVRERATQFRRELELPVRLNQRSLHPYRIKIKKLQYLLQMEKKPGEKPLIAELLEAKDAIGEWHDWQGLAALAREQLQDRKKCPLVDSLETIRDRKYQHALSVANDLRQRHFSSSSAKAHETNRKGNR